MSNAGCILAVNGDSYGALRYFKEALQLYQELGAAAQAGMTQKNIDILSKREI